MFCRRKREGGPFTAFPLLAESALIDRSGLKIYLFFSASAIFMARTFNGSPNRVMKPSASW